MDKSKLTTSSTMTEMRRTAMSKLVKRMALSRFFYHVNLRKLTKKHKIDVGEYLSEKVDFVLINLPYEDQRDRNNFHTELDLFDSNNT